MLCLEGTIRIMLYSHLDNGQPDLSPAFSIPKIIAGSALRVESMGAIDSSCSSWSVRPAANAADEAFGHGVKLELVFWIKQVSSFLHESQGKAKLDWPAQPKIVGTDHFRNASMQIA